MGQHVGRLPHAGEDDDSAFLPLVPQVADQLPDALMVVRRPSDDLLDACTGPSLVVGIVADREARRPLVAKDLRAEVANLLWNGRAEEERLPPRARAGHV